MNTAADKLNAKVDVVSERLGVLTERVTAMQTTTADAANAVDVTPDTPVSGGTKKAPPPEEG